MDGIHGRQMGGWRVGCRCSKLWNVTNTREVNKKILPWGSQNKPSSVHIFVVHLMKLI